MILWITGNSGVGKTTLGRCLAERYNAILLDGNAMRESISENAGFDADDRIQHNLRVARLAKVLESQGFMVIVAVIAPYKATRAVIHKMISPLWIYLHNEHIKSNVTYPYEPPKRFFMDIDTDYVTTVDMVKHVTDAMYYVFNEGKLNGNST